MDKYHISFEIDQQTAEDLNGSIATHKTLIAIDLVRKQVLDCVLRKQHEPEDMFANYWPTGFNHNAQQ